jgi:hypothetical protein
MMHRLPAHEIIGTARFYDTEVTGEPRSSPQVKKQHNSRNNDFDNVHTAEWESASQTKQHNIKITPQLHVSIQTRLYLRPTGENKNTS